MVEMSNLKANLLGLGLSRIAEIFEEEAARACKIKTSYTEYLSRLIEEEVLLKTERSVNTRIANAKFPMIKTLEGFDFFFQPSVSEVLVKELGGLAFLDKAENIILLGPPGVGKTHLAIGFGIKACAVRKRVLFTRALWLMDELVQALVSHTLAVRLEALSRLDLLVIDELGYLPLDKHRANLFFQLVNRCYEQVSTIVTTNRSFKEWGEVFGDEVIAGAVLDRLLHHSHIIVIQGESYRIKDKKTSGLDLVTKFTDNKNVEK